MKGGEKNRNVPSAGSLQISTTVRAGQADVGSPELNLGLPHRRQEPKNLGHQLLPPRVHISRKPELEMNPALEFNHFDVSMRVPGGGLLLLL